VRKKFSPVIFHGGIEVAGGEEPVTDDEDDGQGDGNQFNGRDGRQQVAQDAREKQDAPGPATVVHNEQNDGAQGLPAEKVGAERRGEGQVSSDQENEDDDDENGLNA